MTHLLCAMTHYDVIMGNDVAKTAHCNVIIGTDIVMGTTHNMCHKFSLIPQLLLPLNMSMVMADIDVVVQQVSPGQTWCFILLFREYLVFTFV